MLIGVEEVIYIDVDIIIGKRSWSKKKSIEVIWKIVDIEVEIGILIKKNMKGEIWWLLRNKIERFVKGKGMSKIEKKIEGWKIDVMKGKRSIEWKEMWWERMNWEEWSEVIGRKEGIDIVLCGGKRILNDGERLGRDKLIEKLRKKDIEI